MTQLETHQLEQVNGGVAPLIIAALTVDAWAIGFTSGFLVGYLTVQNLME
ncbi:class IIb bacteriocin, lactobin A/cerein 7B family [Paraferrimonas haliotis]|uniref:Class IIb bacteriocin, lactobin A/cerein 7B family n=1 Tax=Paraferrimonas haliotis TaxID=2013866 RepID=A0AA37TSV1_9GAMM|nr:class IIb bacteriocin, lactobin A/cerein 7B family [Paraferrimonas haliotis]GLS83547.1 hypothetical protein GCM10007894_15240 [Paraferrimonas haliotis]